MEPINHYGLVGYRVTGSGNLKSTFYSLDDVNTYTCPDIAMSTTTAREPLILTNAREQRIALEFKVTEIDEYFTISKLTIFVKPISSEYPR